MAFTENKTLGDYRGRARISLTDLAGIKARLEKRKTILDALGIKYLLIFAPAKWEIYPEYMPKRINRISFDSTLNQVSRFLRDHTDIDALDLRQSLMQTKTRFPVYRLTDTHWSEIGAFTAVQAINVRLRKWFPQVDVERRLFFEKKRGNLGNLG